MIKVSVIIPTCGRPAALRKCLTSLSESDFPRDEFEVIVVDDGSPEPVCLSLDQVPTGFNFVVLRQENAGAGAARNRGVQRARGRFLVFTDDDCLPQPGWLRTIAVRLESAPASVVGGLTINQVSDNVYARVSHLLAHKVYANYEVEPSTIYFFGSANFALARETFDQAGGFDKRLRPAYEDREFCDRLVEKGVPFVYASEAVVAHNRVMTLRTFVAQHVGYGRGASLYYRSGKGRTVRGAGFLLWRVGLQAISKSRGLDRLYAPLMVVVSQLAALAGYSLAWFRRPPPRFLSLLPG